MSRLWFISLFNQRKIKLYLCLNSKDTGAFMCWCWFLCLVISLMSSDTYAYFHIIDGRKVNFPSGPVVASIFIEHNTRSSRVTENSNRQSGWVCISHVVVSYCVIKPKTSVGPWTTKMKRNHPKEIVYIGTVLLSYQIDTPKTNYRTKYSSTLKSI